MTREEAIKQIELYKRCVLLRGAIEPALDMAIAALRERDALLAEIKDMCHLCRHYNEGKGDAACYNCCEEDAFVWRGAKEEV